MPVRSNFRKWITGFGGISSAVFFHPNDNDNNEVPQEDNPWMPPSSSWAKWNHNWDRLCSILSLSMFIYKNVTDLVIYSLYVIKIIFT